MCKKKISNREMKGKPGKQAGNRWYYMSLKMYFSFQNACEEND